MNRHLAILFVAALTVASVGTPADQFFHAAAHNPGVNNTVWLTDAQIFNPDAVNTIEVRLAFLEGGRANLDPDEVAIAIGPRQAVFLADIVAGVFGLAQAGSIRLASDSPFFASSRTYNIGDGESGTYGQYIAAASSDDAMPQGILLLASNDPALAGSRTNVGFVNPALTVASIGVSIYDADAGVLLGSTSLSLPPLGFEQLNNIFAVVGQQSSVRRNATVEFLATAPVLAYASVVDNTSGDAIFVTPRTDTGTPAHENNPPDATIDQPSADVTIAPGESVYFSGSASDPDDDPVTVLWDFGDGISSTSLVPGNHTYTDAGVYTVTLTATDDQGLADPTPPTRTVTVMTSAPTLTQIQTEIFTPRCIACHGGSSPDAGLNLEQGQSHANLVNVPATTQSGTRVIPGNPDDSVLIIMLEGGHRNLTQPLIQLIRDWITAGALDN
jgi:chitodextrinase